MFPDFMYPLISQLAVSAELISSGEPSKNRASIILCDNLVELVAFRIAKERLGQFVYLERINALWEHIESKEKPRESVNKHSWKDWDDGNSQDFATRMGFLVREKVLTDLEREFLIELHRYRNDLYHKGLRWHQVLETMALVYHEFACELITRIPLMYHVVRPVKKADREFGDLFEEVEHMDWTQRLPTFFGKKRKACSKPALLFATFLRSLLQDIDESIGFVLDTEFLGDDVPHILNVGLIESTVGSADRIRHKIQTREELISKALASGLELIKVDPRQSFARRISRLEQERSKLKACVKFADLHRDMERVAMAASKVASDIDEYIEAGAEMLRGK